MDSTSRKVVSLYASDHNINRPFTYKGRPYMRVESVTTVMPQELYHRLLLMRNASSKYRWEILENPDLTFDDINKDEVLKTVRLGIESGRMPESTGSDISDILEKLKLMRKGILNNASIVLFGNGYNADYPQCVIRLARFRGVDKMSFIDSQRIQGNLFELLDAAMTFLFKHLSLSGTIDGLVREEQLAIPYKALREGVINALSHRSYDHAGGSVGIAIYDDRVEIENPGRFPYGWNIEKIKSGHCSDPHNPTIANVLYLRKLLENWGRGISLMTQECIEAGLPEPEYRIDSNFVILIFKYGKSIAKGTGREQVGNKQGTSREQVPEILKVVGNSSYSIKRIMELMNLKGRRSFIQIHLNPVIESGLLESVYPDNPNHPKQAYRLTEKGKLLIKTEHI